MEAFNLIILRFNHSLFGSHLTHSPKRKQDKRRKNKIDSMEPLTIINNLQLPFFPQWAAVFQSSSATCWRSCSTSSCLRKRHRRSCRSTKTRLAGCCLLSPNRRKRNPDFTGKDLTLTAFYPHTGRSGLDLMVSVWNDRLYFGRLYENRF